MWNFCLSTIVIIAGWKRKRKSLNIICNGHLNKWDCKCKDSTRVGVLTCWPCPWAGCSVIMQTYTVNVILFYCDGRKENFLCGQFDLIISMTWPLPHCYQWYEINTLSLQKPKSNNTQWVNVCNCLQLPWCLVYSILLCSVSWCLPVPNSYSCGSWTHWMQYLGREGWRCSCFSSCLCNSFSAECRLFRSVSLKLF